MRLALLAVLLVACGTSEARYVYAIGASDSVPTLFGPCTGSGVAVPVIDSHFEARAPGSTHLTCRDGNVVIVARAAARIAIDPVPSASLGSPLSYLLHAYDASGAPIEVGHESAIVWTFGGALAARPYPGCSDMIPLCPPMNLGFVVPTAPGVGTIEASFGGLTTRSTTTVTP